MALLRAYNRVLNSRPLITQMISAGVIGASGDVICQFAVDRVELARYDYVRTLRFFLLPTFYIAPVLSTWFKVLERIPGSKLIAPLKKVAVDQVLSFIICPC